MDPKNLNKTDEYIYTEPVSELPIKVYFAHETINHYVFISSKEMIAITPSRVRNNIIQQTDATKME